MHRTHLHEQCAAEPRAVTRRGGVTRRIIAVSLGWLGISMISDGVPAVLLPHQLLTAGDHGATTLGLTTLIAIAVAAALQPVAGRWSDSIGRWPVIASGIVLALAGLVLVLTPATLVLGAVVALVGVSLTQAGHQPLLPDLVPVAWRGRASGMKSALDVGGASLGFVLLATMLGHGDAVGATLVLGAALVAPFAVAYLALGRDRPKRRDPRTAGAHRPGPDARRELGTLVVARFLFLLGIFAVGRFLLLFAAARFGMSADAAAAEAGMALALLALLTVAASVPCGWAADLLGRRPLMLVGGALAAIGIGLLPTAGSIGHVVAFGVPMALGSAAFNAASWAALTDLTPSADAGRLLGFANVGTAGAAAAAGAVGLLIDAGNRAQAGHGYTLAFGLSAALTLAGGVVAWRLGPPRPAAFSQIRTEVPQ